MGTFGSTFGDSLVHNGSLVNYLPESIALFARMTETLDSVKKAKINSRVKKLKDAGILAKCDILRFYDGYNEADSLLNWAKDAHNGSKISTPDFYPNVGVKGGTGKAINSNYNPLSQGVNATKDNITLGVFVVEKGATELYLFGSFKTPNQLGVWSSSTAISHSLNSAAFRAEPFTVVDGLISSVRRSATVESAKLNKLPIKDYNVSSSSIPDLNIYELALNNNGVVYSPSTALHKCFFVASGLTDSELEQLHTDLYQLLISDAVNIGIVGDSTIGVYSTFNPVSTYVNEKNYYGLFDVATAGDTIAAQKTKWEAQTAYKKSNSKYTFVQVGLNDLDPAESAATALGRYQSLINSIRAGVGTNKIYTCTMNPCKQRLIDLYGAVNGLVSYQKWLDMNEAIKGNGANAITGMDGFVSSHTDSLSDGNGNLAAAYDSGDHIHENNAGRQIVANAWKAKII